MSVKKILLALVIIAAIVAAVMFDVTQYLNLDTLKAQQTRVNGWFETEPLLTFAIYFVAYVLVTALSIPGATILTLGAGAIFGLGWGVLLASFASSVGALLAFLSARFLLKDWVQSKFGQRLEAINRGVKRDGAFYLLSLRLVPIFPFFVINLALGLTQIRTWTFYWVSQVGMLLGTVVYVNAGTQLAEIEQVGDVVSADLIGAFVLLGIFPLIAKWLLTAIKRRRAFKGFTRPQHYDNNLIVIGAGSAGLVSAYIAATVKAKVTLIERDKMGGDCLNTGCVPSKALLHVANQVHHMRHSEQLGIKVDSVSVDFQQVLARVQQVIQRIEPHDSVERYQGLGVNVELGEATIKSPWEVELKQDGESRRLTTKHIVVATGARPLVPNLPGINNVDYLTSDNLWQLRELPKRLLILGGGPIGCEMAQAFQRLGSEVHLVEMSERLLTNEDPDTSTYVARALQDDGVTLHLGTQAKAFSQTEEGVELSAESEQGEQSLHGDRVLLALGRQANLEGFGLKELGIEQGKTIQVDDFMQTNLPNIYACGDVAGPYQFTHVASHQAWYATVNALFGRFKRFRVDYSVIPWVTYTSPQVANVGLTEQQAKAQQVDYETTCYDIAELDRAIADGSANGRVKVLTQPGKDTILGVNIVGPQAGELLAEFVLAMKQGIGLNKILGTIHSYPTLAEANKYAAGEWKRAHAPEKLLQWVEKLHRWLRS